MPPWQQSDLAVDVGKIDRSLRNTTKDDKAGTTGTTPGAPAGQQEILRETVAVRHNPQMSNYFIHTICQQI